MKEKSVGWLQKLDELAFTAKAVGWMAQERLMTGIVFNPLQKSLRSDPHPFYRELREHSPIHRSYLADGWVLTRYDDVATVLSDRRFGSDERNLSRWPELEARAHRNDISTGYDNGLSTMLREDDPEHTRKRSLAATAFAPRAIDRMQPQIEALLETTFERVPKDGPFDLISGFAAPFPIAVIAGILGVPASDSDRFHAWSDRIIMMIGDGDHDQRADAERARVELAEYIGAIVDERRKDPRQDMISSLVGAEEEGDRLSRDEIVAISILLLVAGNETTTKLIGNSIYALLQNPEQLQLLRDEPKRIPGAVEELLRFDGPVQLTSRTVLEDHRFGGCEFRKGQQVVLLLAAANRDPAKFENADQLDVTRDDCRHLAFSHGAHFCLGAKLARLEARLALEALITRLADLKMASGGVEWGTNTVLRGPQSLWLTTRPS